MMKKYFSPADFLISRSGSPDPAVESGNELGFDKTVFIILNMPIVSVSAINPCKDAKTGADINIFESAWNHCKYKICADGGVNRLYEYFKDDEAKRSKYLPDFIAGDLDSANPKVLKYYESLGVPIHQCDDQYSSDLMKCVKLAQDQWFLSPFEEMLETESTYNGEPAFKVIVIGALGGRVDQSFHSLHNLYMINDLSKEAARKIKARTDQNSIGNDTNILDSKPGGEDNEIDLYKVNRVQLPHDMILLSAEETSVNLTFLLPSHSVVSEDTRVLSVISTPREYLGPAIGILPLQGLTHITTHGLQWDITDWETEFGGRVSTSNYLQSDVVEVEAGERPVIFTVEVKLLDPK